MKSTKIAYALVGAIGLMGMEAGSASAKTAGTGLESVIRSPIYGTPSMLKGRFVVRASSRDAIGVAQQFLREQRGLTGISNPDSELEVADVFGPDDIGMTHVKFAHNAQGIPVFGSELWIHMKGNVVTSMNGVFLPSIRAQVKVDVEADEAVTFAVDHVAELIDLGAVRGDVSGRQQDLGADLEPELTFFNQGLISDERTPTSLAWQVRINGVEVFVDAMSGDVLDAFDTVHSAMYRTVYDANNGTSLPGKKVCQEGQGCSTADPDANAAYNQFEQIYNYWKNTHNRDSYDGRGAELVASVHYSDNFVNAYWDGDQMVFGDDMVALDVTAHELGHGVCQTTANLTYKSQSGALNESLSDVWAVMIDREDWLIGEDLPIGAIRSMSDPNAYNQPKDMTEYKKYIFYDNGGVHINSGIPNYALYLASAGGSNQGVTVRGQGRPVTEAVWYRTEVSKLTSSSKFVDFANACIASCEELYSKGSTQCVEITNAFKAVKIL